MRESEREVLGIPQLYPKQQKMETQYKADSLLITLAGWQLHDNCVPSIGMIHPLRV